MPLLKRLELAQVGGIRRPALDPATLSRASAIVEEVRARGEQALRDYAAQLDGLGSSEPLILSRSELEAAAGHVPTATTKLLARCADRIRVFAEAQRACLVDLALEVPGGSAGHAVHPLRTAGCYAPGGRFPLVSSMLMTVATARAAGVAEVWAASPRPFPVMCAAAVVAGADGLLAAGGAQAIAALAYGAGLLPRCDAVVGPGNRWVTAAKQIVSADVRIDMLAGPSELLIIADDSADPRLIAADLLAQAEHDPDASPMLVTTSPELIDSVESELANQLETLPTRVTAEAALANGFAAFAADREAALHACTVIAPEHVALHVRDAGALADRVRSCGCVFVGSRSAEVFGDYGIGPNHTLPTGGTARFASGLSVLTFLRLQAWTRLDTPAGELLNDVASLARLEGLEAHARSAEQRQP